MSNESGDKRTTATIMGLPKGLVAAVGVLAVLIAMAGLYGLFGGEADIAQGTTFIAKQGPLDITVVEGGSVEALESQEIRSEIKGHAGVKILRIIEEGYFVTPQDVEDKLVLVELDSADLRDKLVNQEISYESAQAQYIEKQAQYDIQVNQNQSNMTASELTAKFALMDFQKFLGKKAVDSIVETLGLREKAAELEKVKAAGGRIAPLPELPADSGIILDENAQEPREWPEASASGPEGGRGRPEGWEGRGDRGERGARGPGASGGSGSGGRGPGGPGGGMDPERFQQMIKENGGKMPEAMAERMRQMGMDPDEMVQRMMAGEAPQRPSRQGAPIEQPGAEIEVKHSFTANPEYTEARAELNFSEYANVEQLEDGEAKQDLRGLEDEIITSEEELRLAKTHLEGQERLAEKDFITRNELELERLKVTKANIKEESAAIDLALYIEYTFPKSAELLLSDYEEALMNLERTMQEAGAKLSQAEAGRKSAEAKFHLEGEQLLDLRDQIDKCVIVAERSGLVVYGSSTGSNPWRRSNEQPIQEGTTVRQRQSIITIPDTRHMGVTVNVHESAVQRVTREQTVKLVIDAFVERPLTGTVERVAVLADSANMFMNPDMKVYPTSVRIDGIHGWLRPGMSAQVEILVDHLEDVTYIPLQAVSYFGDTQVCYVVNNGKPERRVITTGSFTDDFIEIKSGLEAGEEVLLLAPDAGEQDDMGPVQSTETPDLVA